MSCSICLMDARGFHFNVFSCRACAAFFRRSVVLNLFYRCQRERNCDVTKKQRFSCRYCRYQKCLATGMTPEVVHIPIAEISAQNQLKASQSEQQLIPTTLEEPEFCGVPTDTFNDCMRQSSIPTNNFVLPSEIQFIRKQCQVKQRIDSLFDWTDNIKTFGLPIKLTLAQQATMALSEHSKKWPMCAPDKIRRTQTCDLRRCAERMIEDAENIAQFCMSLDEFASLPKDQKWLLFKMYWMRFGDLERYVTMFKTVEKLTPSTWLTHDGELMDISIGRDDRCNEDVISEVEAQKLFEMFLPICERGMKLIGNQLVRVNPTTCEISFCFLQVLWGFRAGNGITTETAQKAEIVRQRLAGEVHDYYTFEMKKEDHAGRIMKLMNIVAALDEMEQQRQEDSTLFRTFSITKFNVFVDFT